MDNELDGDLVIDAGGDEAGELTSPLACWHRISPTLKEMPELPELRRYYGLCRYLANPRLCPSKVAKLSQDNT